MVKWRSASEPPIWMGIIPRKLGEDFLVFTLPWQKIWAKTFWLRRFHLPKAKSAIAPPQFESGLDCSAALYSAYAKFYSRSFI